MKITIKRTVTKLVEREVDIVAAKLETHNIADYSPWKHRIFKCAVCNNGFEEGKGGGVWTILIDMGEDDLPSGDQAHHDCLPKEMTEFNQYRRDE